jgi:anti-sigma28 factor (negative regulator of flagellin synthesis)
LFLWRNFALKEQGGMVDGVGMSNTTRHTTQRRPAVPAQKMRAPMAPPQTVVSSNKVDTLRRLVAAGQYHVSPKYLAMKIFRAAGIKETEE